MKSLSGSSVAVVAACMTLVGPLAVADGLRVDIDVERVPLIDVIEDLAAATGTEYVSYADLSERVTVKLEHATLSSAITRLLRGRSYTLIENSRIDDMNHLWIFGELDRPLRGGLQDPREAERRARLRLEVVAALAESDEPASAASLAAALGDESAAVRAEVAYALSTSDDVTSVLLLRHALTDADVNVREAAVESLADIGDQAAIAALGEALNDPDADVRETAIYRIAELDAPEALALLERALRDPLAELREIASELVEELALD